MNEMIAAIVGCAILGFFGFATIAILVGIFREEPRYQARPVRVTPPCGPACGDYTFTGWTAEQAREWSETAQAPASMRGVLPEPSRAELSGGRQAHALPSGAAQRALPEGKSDETIEIRTRQGEWVKVRR